MKVEKSPHTSAAEVLDGFMMEEHEGSLDETTEGQKGSDDHLWAYNKRREIIFLDGAG